MYLRVRAPGAGRPLRGTVFWAEVVLGVGMAIAIADKKKAKSSRAMLEDILNMRRIRSIGEKSRQPGYRGAVILMQDQERQKPMNAVLPPIDQEQSRLLLRYPKMINWNRNGSTEQADIYMSVSNSCRYRIQNENMLVRT